MEHSIVSVALVFTLAVCCEGGWVHGRWFRPLVHHLDTLPMDINIELHSSLQQAQLGTACWTHAAMRKAASTPACTYVTLIISSTTSQ